MTIYVSSRVLPYVYKLTHTETGQFYFGYREANKLPSSEDLGKKYFSSSKVIKHLGFKNFQCEIIAEFFSADDAYDFEQFVIKDHFRNSLILNSHHREGSENRFKSTKTRSDATKTKMKKPKSAEHALNISNGRKGIIFTPEHCKNLGHRKGIARTLESRLKQSASLKGKRHSDESYARQAETQRGKCRTPETIEKISERALQKRKAKHPDWTEEQHEKHELYLLAIRESRKLDKSRAT